MKYGIKDSDNYIFIDRVVGRRDGMNIIMVYAYLKSQFSKINMIKNAEVWLIKL